MKGLAVLVLRYKKPGDREFRVPFNLHDCEHGNPNRRRARHPDVICDCA